MRCGLRTLAQTYTNCPGVNSLVLTVLEVRALAIHLHEMLANCLAQFVFSGKRCSGKSASAAAHDTVSNLISSTESSANKA